MKNLKAQSQIVATVLLILIVVAAAVVIMSFVLPFVNKQLDKGKCFEVVDKLEIVNNAKYTCQDLTDPDNRKVSVQIHIGPVSDLVSGFIIEFGGAASKTYEITKKTDNGIAHVMNYNGQEFGEALKFPGNNEERTYVFEYDLNNLGAINSIDVYAKLADGQICASSDSVKKVPFCKVG